ncbi:MAG TPA: CBS domain-containing protein [Nitrospiraceae bacterium]|nr:CBS domain-containing protein [Nitrospiraceae bacterium]
MTLLKEIMTPQVDVISADATAEDASTKMKQLNVGAIPVCDGNRLIGMVTDRDLVVRVMADRRDPKAVQVQEAMTPEVSYCFEDDEVEQAARLMAERQIRRLPILSRAKELVGIVSLGDLAVHGKDATVSGSVLEHVSRPAQPRR